MANITLFIANTGEKVQVLGIDLETVTNTELIRSALEEGVLLTNPIGERAWALVDKHGKPIVDETKTLADIGYKDRDEIRVISILYGV